LTNQQKEKANTEGGDWDEEKRKMWISDDEKPISAKGRTHDSADEGRTLLLTCQECGGKRKEINDASKEDECIYEV